MELFKETPNDQPVIDNKKYRYFIVFFSGKHNITREREFGEVCVKSDVFVNPKAIFNEMEKNKFPLVGLATTNIVEITENDFNVYTA